MQRNVVITSLFWKLVEKTSAQVIQLIVTIILARLLLPADYGTLAMVAVFIAVLTVFVEGGFNTAIIQSKNIDDVDCNSVFLLNAAVSVILYLLIFFVSELIARIYDNGEIIIILRVYAVIIIISAFSVVQSALLYRRMMFKLFFKKTIVSLIISGVAGIGLAYCGFGVWALVAQQITNKLLLCILLWGTVKWFPKPKISLKRLRVLFLFGINVLINNLLGVTYNQLRSFIVGIKYTPEELAFYNKGEQFPAMIATSTDYAFQGVMLSVYSKDQDDFGIVKSMLRRTIKTGCYVLLPIMAGLAATAESLVKILLTDKWLPCVPYMQLLCVVYAFQTIRASNMQAIYGIGKSKTVLTINIISKLAGTVILIIAAQMGVLAIAIGAVITSLIMTVIYSIPGAKYFGYTAKEQISDVFAPTALSLLMFGWVYAMSFLPVTAIYKLLLQMIVGILIYFGLSHLLRLESFLYLKNMAKEFMITMRIRSKEKKGKSG